MSWETEQRSVQGRVFLWAIAQLGRLDAALFSHSGSLRSHTSSLPTFSSLPTTFALRIPASSGWLCKDMNLSRNPHRKGKGWRDEKDKRKEENNIWKPISYSHSFGFALAAVALSCQSVAGQRNGNAKVDWFSIIIFSFASLAYPWPDKTIDNQTSAHITIASLLRTSVGCQ